VPSIAKAVAERFASTPPEVPVFLIRDHGITVWGTSLQEAANRVEIAVYLFEYMVQARAVGVAW
jgi:methylthioribulose-1-phosphate dehydratase